jgi:hypothetical protein
LLTAQAARLGIANAMAGAAAAAPLAAPSPSLAGRSLPLRASAPHAALCWRRGVAPAPLRARPGPSRRRSAAAAPPGAKQLRMWPVPEVWEEFVKKHAGEWDSYSARFSAEGAAMELPRKYIPEAYVEWERTLHEWPGRVVSQCKKRGGPRQLTHKLERFWPAVGCEYGKARLPPACVAALWRASAALRALRAPRAG